MIPKAYDDELLNMLNHMSAPTKERTFLGFIKIEGKLDYWGIDLEESCICGVYMFNTPQKQPVADDVRETESVSRNYPYVLFFHGSDNTSYIKRFKTEKILLKWFFTTDYFKFEQESNVYFYNS